MSDVDELIEVKPKFMGFPSNGYPGAFSPALTKKIRQVVSPPCLHLFSGTSKIGDVRIDLERPEATINCDVFEFIRTDERNWAFVLLDPPYALRDPTKKLGYADSAAVSSSVPKRRLLERFFQAHADNILWFDYVSPCPRGFYRHKFWVYLQGSYHQIRCLTWLKREGERLV